MVKNLFFLGIILAASGILSPPLALAAGLAYGLSVAHEYHLEARRLSKFLLQASVVCLGFGMNLAEVVRVGRSGFVYTALGIAFALLLGTTLALLLRVGRVPGFLISAGTAICGGSAIAALAPVTDASEESIAVSMGTVFVLNSVALFIFPAIGQALHLSQTQFGLWSALAIHDTSSVVGAAARYGPSPSLSPPPSSWPAPCGSSPSPSARRSSVAAAPGFICPGSSCSSAWLRCSTAPSRGSIRNIRSWRASADSALALLCSDRHRNHPPNPQKRRSAAAGARRASLGRGGQCLFADDSARMDSPVMQSTKPHPLVAFYRDGAPDDAGRSRAEVLAWDDDRLEAVHDFIQWLFPLPEPSGANPAAPILDPATIKTFRASLAMRDRLRASYDRMSLSSAST